MRKVTLPAGLRALALAFLAGGLVGVTAYHLDMTRPWSGGR